MFLDEKSNLWAAKSYASHPPCLFAQVFTSVEIKESLSFLPHMRPWHFSAACTQRLAFRSERKAPSEQPTLLLQA